MSERVNLVTNVTYYVDPSTRWQRFWRWVGRMFRW